MSEQPVTSGTGPEAVATYDSGLRLYASLCLEYV